MKNLKRRTGPVPLVLCILGATFDIPVNVLGTTIPTVLPLFVLFFIPQTSRFLFSCAPYALAWIACALFSELMSPDKETSFFLKFIFQSVFSIISLMAAHTIVRRYEIAQIYRAASFLLLILVILGTLERFTPLGEVFQQIGHYLYSGESGFKFSSAEQSLERDLALIGHQRATILMAEPSLAAVAIVFLIALRCMIAPQASAITNFLTLGAAYYLVGSPFLVLGVLFQLLFLRDVGRQRYTNFPRVFVPVLFVLFFGLQIFGNRLHNFDLNAAYMTSEALRFLVPWHIFISMLDQGFWFGIGPSGIYDETLLTNLSGGISDTVGTNAFLALFICFGPIIPIILFIFVAFTQGRSFRDKKVFITFIIFSILISMTLGAFMAPKIWVMLGIGAAAIQHSCCKQAFSVSFEYSTTNTSTAVAGKILKGAQHS